jgi:hypothetical protein
MYKFNIKSGKKVANGILFSILVPEKEIKLLFTHHAMQRIKEWSIKREAVINTMLFPDEVLVGHRDRFIAQKIYGKHIVRCVYEYKNNIPVIIMVYFPYKERYFEGGGHYANKIF